MAIWALGQKLSQLTYDSFGALPHSENILCDGQVAGLSDPFHGVQETVKKASHLEDRMTLTILRRR